MKDIEFSPNLLKKLQAVHRKDKPLVVKIQKQLKLFQTESRHNSLRLHKLKGELKNAWSISIDRNHRLLYTEDEQSIYFFDMGTHDEVYKQ
ncbi:MAG: type II toxin-antitoxin system mRNA interferase toxin, RelE/StbE family [bacterium]|nr:type II toxin-antitoxin system mRNA interferase toxin, RelE/StbE family [bacterium]